MRTFIIGVSSVGFLMLSSIVFAQESKFGTADEAKAMLLKAVAAVKADKEVALAMFNKGEGGFRDRDLYPFCFRLADGKYVANPALAVTAGTDTHTLKDPTGKVFGEELYAGAQKPEGQITEVTYMFPKPGTTAPAVPKVSFVTKVGDLGCGVGYYE
jgi:signal transduction histidine kinase